MNLNRRDSRSNVNRKEKIYLSKDNVVKRIFLFLLALTIAIVSFGFAIKGLIYSKPGWTQIEVSGMGISVNDDFYLLYNLGQNGHDATADRKTVSVLYKKLVVDSYYLFSKEAENNGYQNLNYLNKNINKEITVDKALYNALKQAISINDRYLYLAPVYQTYQGVFQCDQDYQTDDYNPWKNEEIANYFNDVCTFINNGDIKIELLENNRVILHVSEQYENYCKENYVDAYVEFGWLRNAFIADYMANELENAGYCEFILASQDGYIVSRNSSEEEYMISIYDHQQENLQVASYGYEKYCCMAQFKKYPISNLDMNNYYVLADDTVLGPYCSVADGKNYSGCQYLAVTSSYYNCGQIALSVADYYINNQLDADMLKSDSNIAYVYLDGKTIYASENCDITNVRKGYTLSK